MKTPCDITIICRFILHLILVLFMTGLSLRPADARRAEFRIASLANTYMGMHAKESRLALQMIMQKILNDKHPEFRLKLDFLLVGNGLVDTLRSTPYDLLALSIIDYFKLRDQINLHPLSILSRVDSPTEPFLLITLKGKNLKRLATQQNRTLLVEFGGSGEVARLWLDAILKTHQLPAHQEFFTTVRTADKPSRLVLPVFFGQADACVVAQSAYSLLAELNPQIKENLTVLAQSEGHIDLLICATDQLEAWAREIVLEQTQTMHTSLSGQQTLTILQRKRFFTFRPEYLKATEELYQQHHYNRRER